MTPGNKKRTLYLIIFVIMVPSHWRIEAFPLAKMKNENIIQGSDIVSILLYSDSRNHYLKSFHNIEHETLHKLHNKDSSHVSVVPKPVREISRNKRNTFRESKLHTNVDLESKNGSDNLDVAGLMSEDMKTESKDTMVNDYRGVVLTSVPLPEMKEGGNITSEANSASDAKIIEVRVTSSVAVSRSNYKERNREGKYLSEMISEKDDDVDTTKSDPIALAASEKRSIASAYPFNKTELSTSYPKYTNGRHYKHGIILNNSRNVQRHERRNHPRSFSYSSVFNNYRHEDTMETVWTPGKNVDGPDGYSTYVDHDDKKLPHKAFLDDIRQKQKNHDISPVLQSLPIVYSEPAKVYSEPAKVYGEPAKVYGEPELVYSEPARVYSEPAKVYGEPAKVYSEPAKNYGEPSKFYSEPASLGISPGDGVNNVARSTWRPRFPIDPNGGKHRKSAFSSAITTVTPVTKVEDAFGSSEQNYEVNESTSVISNGRVHGVQEIDVPNNGKKVGYVVEGKNYRKYRVEERTSDGFIVGEYGVVSHGDGSLRGVRYTADGETNPRLIYDALLKFLSL